MTNEQKQVKEWMQQFGQDTPDKPCIPSEAIRKLRAELTLEEAFEEVDALGFEVKCYEDNPNRPLTGLQVSMANIQLKSYVSQESLELTLTETLEKLADALGDLHYVAYCGTAVAFGLDMEEIFQEIHRSNLTKFWKWDELNKADLDWTVTKFSKHEERPFLVKNKSGKVMKSPSFEAPKLKEIIERQML